MLTTRRPTPTTVQYTVSTRPSHDTIASRLSTYISIVVRVLAGILVATVLLHETQARSLFLGRQHGLKWLETTVLHSPIGHIAAALAAYTTWPWRFGICVAVAWLIFRKGYTEESLLVIRGLGVQTTTSAPSYLWSRSTRFIPTSSIQDIFIHEAFKGFEVRFYLSIVVEGEEDVVVVFPTILPKRELLEQVWRGARACLYEPKS